MRYWRFIGACAAAAVCSTPALAQMTADQVWQDWQALSASMGQSMVAGNTASSNGTLTVEDITVTSSQDDVTVTGTIEQIVFRERGDGTVEITMSETYPLTIVAPDESGELVTMTMAITQTGMVMVASGTAGDVTYDITADRIAVALDEIGAGPDVPSVDMSVEMSDVTGRYNITDSNAFTADLRAARMAFDLAGQELDDADSFSFRASIVDIDISSAVSGLDMMETEDFAAALRAGMAVDVGFTHGAVDYAVAAESEFDGANNIAGSSDSGSLRMTLNADQFLYAVSSLGTDFTFASDELPMPPLAFALDELTFSFAMPLLQTETPRDFSVVTRLVGLVVDDMLWGMFDPGNVLPRDPATAIIDLAGRITLKADLAGDPVMQAGQVPAEPESLSLRELRLSAVGAELTGEGEFAFDNTDLVTFDGMPRPMGAVNLRLVGGNALVDRLVQLGYLPPDQAMGARMMMGLFGRPGEGEDTLTSTIEVREDGGIYANGQRIQ